MVRIPRLLAVVTLALFAAPALAQTPIKIIGLVELSGTGATSGTNFDNGAKLAARVQVRGWNLFLDPPAPAATVQPE